MGRKGREMERDTATAKKYRKRADDIRLIAGLAAEAETKRLLLSVANIYERLASMVGGIAYAASNSN